MNVLVFLLPPLLAGLLSFAITPLVRRLAWRVGAVDAPGPRKVHKTPTPRLGGLAVVAAVLSVGALCCFGTVPGFRALPHELCRGAAFGLLPILVVSVWDDIRSVPSSRKFVVHLVGALIAVSLGVRLGATIHLFGHEFILGALAVPISLLWIVGVTNAFNLIDGLDGLSAGLALISSVSLSGVFLLMGRVEIAAASLVLGGALLGFLPYNLYPASVFLGDSGATAIGFFLACLALRSGSSLSAGFAVLVPVIILGLPLADTLISMARRLVRRMGKKAAPGLFDADREHIHHRLMALGMNHRRSVVLLYGVGVVLAAAGYLSILSSARGAALLLATLVAAGFIGVSRLAYEEFAVIRRGLVLKIYEVPALKRGLFAVFVDLALAAVALYVSIGLKYDDWSLQQNRALLRHLVLIVPAVTLSIFWAFRLYRGAWKNASVGDLLRTSSAVVVSAVTAYAACQFVVLERPPLSLFAIEALTLLVAVNGSRFSYRILAHWNLRASHDQGDPILIYGAGVRGTMALREVLSNGSVGMRPIGFIDDDPAMTGRNVNGYTVLGTVENLEDFIRIHGVKGLVVASERITRERLDLVRTVCERMGSRVFRFRIGIRSGLG